MVFDIINTLFNKKFRNFIKVCQGITFYIFCYTLYLIFSSRINKQTLCSSFYQPMNAIISHKTLLKHSDMFQSCQVIIRALCSLLKLYYSIHNSIRICKQGVVAAYRVVWECVVEQWQGLRHMLNNK